MADPRSGTDAPKGAQAEGPATAGAARRRRVLVVDDDPRVLDSIEAILSQELDVITCMSGEQALRILETTRFHLVCADYKMSGMNGLELLEKVAQLPHKTSTLLITGCNDYTPIQGQTRHYVMFKPFDPPRLLSLVLQLARLWDMKRSVKSLSDTVGAPESSHVAPSSRTPGSGQAAAHARVPESSIDPDSKSGPRSSRTPRAPTVRPGAPREADREGKP